jgi:putative phosphoribosyl transferase
MIEHGRRREVLVRLETRLWRVERALGEQADPQHHRVTIPVDGVTLLGDLVLPALPVAVVVFAHGSGSSRLSPRNLRVAARLNASGLATLLFDLLTGEEAFDRSNVFDIELLARRLGAATRFVHTSTETEVLPVSYFGASTGAAAALWAAAEPDIQLSSIVSRGGRPDLAAEHLALVAAPTLLIVGGADETVLELNRDVLARLRCEAKLVVVAGAGHLFEEPGALDRVADLATDWVVGHLGPARR